MKEVFCLIGEIMFQLTRFLKRVRKECVIGPLFKLLEACFELIVPMIMAGIIDVGILNRDTSYIFSMGGLLVLFGVLGFVCSITAQYFAAKAALSFGTALRTAFLEHINKFSYKELDETGTASLINRMTSDINQAQTGVNLVLRLFLRSPFLVAGAILCSFFIHWKLALILTLTVFLLGFVIYLVMSRTVPWYKKIQGSLDQLAKRTRENLSGVRVIRAFGKQEQEVEQFSAAASQLLKQQQAASRISSLLNPMTLVLVNLGIVLLLWVSGTEVNMGAITQGEVIALINYMTQILLALVALANLIIQFSKASASAIRINEIFSVTPSFSEGEGGQPSSDRESSVIMEDVSFSYHKDTKVLSHISFQAKRGEMIGIIGGTGSGKTTLVHLIPRFYDATGGRVLVNGCDVKEYRFEELRKKIGVVLQESTLFSGTIRENMKWGKEDATDQEIFTALSLAQAQEFIEEQKEQLNTMILAGGKNLSGGQRQRLTIARALVADPEILILDDSASALDFATEAKLCHAIQEELKEKTVFWISQRIRSIQHADQILVLDDGKMAGSGTHESLLKTCSVYQEIYASQEQGGEI